MRKKFTALVLSVLLLAGCGASAPMEEAAPEAAGEGKSISQSVIMEKTPGPEETAADGASEYGVNNSAAGAAAETDTAPSEASYFTFSRREQNVTDENGQPLLYERYCQTDFYTPDEGLQTWIDEVLAELEQEFQSNSENLLEYAQEFLDTNGAEYFYSYSNYQELGITRHDSQVISLVSLSSLYSGGVHPNSVQTAWNLDLQNRKLLVLVDVIEETGAEALSRMVLQKIDEKFGSLGEGALFGDYGETVTQSLRYGVMTPYWYLSDTGLVVFFNQYELGPYAAGIIKAELPYAELDGILKPEYFPFFATSARGDLKIAEDRAGGTIHITIESEGESLLIGVEGTVYQVQLSEIYWLEETAIGQQILFSADALRAGNVLQITGGYTDDGKSYAIEFLDASGERNIYYLSREGLSEEP